LKGFGAWAWGRLGDLRVSEDLLKITEELFDLEASGRLGA
jgi:hypothetical protein